MRKKKARTQEEPWRSGDSGRAPAADVAGPAAALPAIASCTAAAATSSDPASTAEVLFSEPAQYKLHPAEGETQGRLELRRQARRVTIHWEPDDQSGVAGAVVLQRAKLKKFQTTKRGSVLASGKARIRLMMAEAHDCTREQVFNFAGTNSAGANFEVR